MNGDRNGLIEASINTSGTTTWLDNGSNVANRYSLSAGSYTIVATTPDGLCADTVTVTITQPSAITVSAQVLDQTSLTAPNGSISSNIIGGSPCPTTEVVGSGTVVHYHYVHLYMDGNTEILMALSCSLGVPWIKLKACF